MTSFEPSFREFKKLSRRYNLIPVYKTILADFETPVSAFSKISSGPYSYLLESVEKGDRLGRYSFISTDPAVIFSCRGNVCKIESRISGISSRSVTSDPLGILKGIMEGYRPAPLKGLPRFYGGAVGYMAYDMVRSFEKLKDGNKDDLSLPDILFMITDNLLIFDHVAHAIKVISCAHIDDHAKIEKAYKRSCRKVDSLIAALRAGKPKKYFCKTKAGNAVKPRSNYSKTDFCSMIKRAKKYIANGDIIQTVLSQRMEMPVRASSFDIYRGLRVINPSPYMYYLEFEGFSMAGSSPEILVRKEGNKLELRPIAGTRPRSDDEKEDMRLEIELLNDAKERAEHIMLVDLGRNDLGRVSEHGSVHIPELMVIERYSHVMHIVSEVRSRIKKDLTSFDVLRACFPAGTVSGAPKIRAMEIIEELENRRRGPYAGAVGYFSFQGNMDMAINIRTILVIGNRAYVQAGAGIVHDSKPGREYIETMNKSKAMLDAIYMAEKGLE